MTRDTAAITARNLSKVYKLYDNVQDKTIDLLGLNWMFFWRRITTRSFSALKDLNLNIKHGERVGIIGQNGAGKTTLLKLITGAISHTEGELEINGEIQALMQVGLGFHPEFTGRENIEASLLYSGLNDQEKTEATLDIIDFCELGQFLDQPFKTYSLGMRARLQFACATAIKPDILVIDEILGAGDAYFSLKSSARMENLTKSGCTLLLVSHSMAQILQFCERVIWIKDGKVEQEGPALKVVKAYEHWMHEKSLASGLVNATAKSRPRDDMREDRDTDEAGETPAATTEENGNLADTLEKSPKEEAATELVKASGEAKGFDETSRWETDGAELRIHDIRLLDENQQQNRIFNPDTNMTVEIQIEAQKNGTFPCAVVVHIMSEDGRSVIWSSSETYSLKVKRGEITLVYLEFAPLMLNKGRYNVASALFDQIVPLNKAAAYRYDLISRGYGFVITDAYDGNDSLFRHPATWSEAENRIS